MREEAVKLHVRDLKTKLLPLLVGRVFHVTDTHALGRIRMSGAIKHNANEEFEFTFGQSRTSYFRSRQCISVCDLRSASQGEIEDSLGKYYFLNPRFVNNGPIFLFLREDCLHRLISWKKWKEDAAYTEMVVPYIEAGYPGNIEVGLVESILRVEVENALDPLVEALESARQRLTLGKRR